MHLWRKDCARTLLLTFLLSAFATSASADPIPFRRVIELALQKSGAITAAAADENKAYFTWKESRAAYVPTVVFGSGLGYSFGVPLSIEGSAPSIFNVNTQQYLINFAQKELIKAAKADLSAAKIDTQDKRNGVVLDAAVAYVELDNLTRRITALKEQQQIASKATYISSERVKEGVDSTLDAKRTQLGAARVQLRIAEAEATADVMRQRLASMTGLPAATIETVSDSIPRDPEISQEEDLAAKAVANDPSVRSLDEKVRAAELRARGEHRQNLPSIDAVSQYALFSRYNNYDEFYRKFSRNNFNVGVSIRVPFLNLTQRYHAEAADADVVIARKKADAAKAELAEQTLKLQRGLRQLAAASEVARLDYEVSDATIAATDAKGQSGEPNARETELAKLEAGDKFQAYLEAQLQLIESKLQILRTTGDLEQWALGK